MKKHCPSCKKFKKAKKFGKDKTRKNGLCCNCKKCRIAKYRDKTNKIKTIYNAQISHSKIRKHIPPNYTKQELIDWCTSQPLYYKLYRAWRKSNYSKWLAPSCDRIDDYKSYTLDNIQLMTWEENSNKGHYNRKNGKLITKQNKAVVQYNKNGIFIAEYHSIHKASSQTNTSLEGICRCCKKKLKSSGGFIWRYKDD